jgi:hypothetical protein
VHQWWRVGGVSVGVACVLSAMRGGRTDVGSCGGGSDRGVGRERSGGEVEVVGGGFGGV